MGEVTGWVQGRTLLVWVLFRGQREPELVEGTELVEG
jgi:hypothetical protein